ncbi:hypothetical protein HYC85_028120 [Camellia sinensis]|uniref:Coatomer WD associated region domain-containing protein n=1 Tax=Camellia sinensis TaxID=4442 RepID=A0A7J7FUI1_CAMSI|nr:hypothetical protein HYC85_028120 [Camellia sinensis]
MTVTDNNGDRRRLAAREQRSRFFAEFNSKLLESSNYITRRQVVKKLKKAISRKRKSYVIVRSAKFIARKQWVVAGAGDMYIRVYNYNTMDKVKVFEAHTDYIRCMAVHPTLPYVLPSSYASICAAIIWNLGSPGPNFTLDAHLKGVNCVDYFTGGDKPYFITGSDDHNAKVWDYQTKSCVQTLDGHTYNVSTVRLHPELPIIITDIFGVAVCFLLNAGS